MATPFNNRVSLNLDDEKQDDSKRSKELASVLECDLLMYDVDKEDEHESMSLPLRNTF